MMTLIARGPDPARRPGCVLRDRSGL